MTKIDPALDAIRKIRHEISRDFDNDPARLIAYYVERQRRVEQSKLVRGPEDHAAEPKQAEDAAQLGR
jgi:hypothetical protein